MDQISFFSAEASGPRLADLAGLLCGQGRLASFGRTAARLTVRVEQPWRASLIAHECRRRGVDAEVSASEEGEPLVRTPFRVDLLPMAGQWGIEKSIPAGFRLDGAMLRLWALACGRSAAHAYLLAVDLDAPETHEPLVGALAALGVPAQLVGPRGGGPAIKVTGRRRLACFAELIGTPPAAALPAWPETAKRAG
ncbi:hypothetical protein SAMN05421504_102397 [Amycolatopsis xylanica]|uniref:Uncharacterized protein n=1 Tax=Amycolatopsis xylanica TaxID=589385 RepID=A0A1H2Z6Q0_9PSEU|nr:hypothetical protein [Amycolatopsis xylanica]SDX13016.1 hypothetical protein SAMN05421504_102397 [Amycolatopsis xylanica]